MKPIKLAYAENVQRIQKATQTWVIDNFYHSYNQNDGLYHVCQYKDGWHKCLRKVDSEREAYWSAIYFANGGE